MRVLDLFSGIGGFSLGLERAGMTTVAFCEIDPYCRAVLKKHWPHVPQYEDVRSISASALARDGIAVDAICGGFPCQDVSHAGRRAGLEGARSGLWGEYARLIGELRPRYVLVENVPGLLSLGMGRVLRDLATLGYDAFWDCVPASAVGAHHRRDRVWIVAHASSDRRAIGGTGHEGFNPVAALQEQLRAELGRDGSSARAEAMANASGPRPQIAGTQPPRADGQQGRRLPSAGSGWATEPDVGRVAHGIPARVDRLKSLGNAVVPQVVEIIGRAIMENAA